ncbi:hypothetical protein BCR34DRAFT_594598 [Clohesyomyces aquaticus]|uniref:PAT1 multi-domain protein n=1 Tax=Clohesyomyces aquaticus TaxID=1231657 RepID=A0A1Y1Y6X7_9PLEO|nr:hypothetical protein BCR34DRAFT_594598 [Clohesyomyces aquaticus]
MVILGGLEIVIGGYLVHRYQKNKHEKRKLEEDVNQRRHHTFPGPKPQSQPYASYPPHPQAQQQIAPQKYAYYAPHQQSQPRPYPVQPAPQTQHQPYPPQPQQYPQARPQFHPQAQPQFQSQMQPLRRQDSFATLSNMPIANGSPPEDSTPSLPPRQQPQNPQAYLAPPANSPYYNTGFSASYPSFEPSSTGPMTQPRPQQAGTHTVDDNWETYGPQSPHVHFAVPSSPRPAEREDDPPPPYRP